MRTLLIRALVVFAAIVSPMASAETFNPDTVAPDHSGFWIGGDSIGDRALIKYDNDANLVIARSFGTAEGFPDPYYYKLLPLRDGGLIVIGVTTSAFGELAPGFSIHRVDATGVKVWSLQGLSTVYFPGDNYQASSIVYFGADAAGDIWFPANGDLEHVNPQGVLTDLGAGNFIAGAVDANNGALYVAAAADTNLLNPQQVLRYDTGGNKTVVWTAPDAETVLEFLTVGTDGNVYGIGENSSAHVAVSITPTGQTRWTTTFGSSLYGFSQYGTPGAQVAAYPNGSIVAIDTSSALYVVDTAGNASTLPNSAYLPPYGSDSVVQTSPDGDIVIFNFGQLLRLSSSGQVLFDTTAELGDPTILADGTMLIADYKLPTNAPFHHVDRNGNSVGPSPNLDVSLTQPAQIPVTQSGIAGAWYPEAEGGQGFTLDYIASAQTIFVPWFTYETTATSDASGQAWITLQGTAAPGATSVDLVIARANPGVFNSGQEGVTQVGTAHLWFTDCSNGRLQYQFDANDFGGQGGLIPLTRISPSTSPCTLANGSTSPAQNTNAPSHGFDARQSGSWFDLTTSGQGIQLTIVPAGASGNGLLFGAWFTFDAPPADDAAHEHWFTLQGDFSTASNGVVHVPIVQTVGGTLDGAKGLSSVQVGTATLTMLACDTATLNYQFDNSSSAGKFAGLIGIEHLIKVGGCTAQ